MKINNLKVNGINNPMGFSFNEVIISWNVEDTISKEVKNVLIEVSLNEEFTNVVFEKRGINLLSYGEKLEILLEPCTRYFWRVTVEGDLGDIAISDSAYFETGKMDNPWNAEWIGPSEEDKFHPIIYKELKVNKKIRRARIYISGLGLYELYINNEKVGNEYLAPYLNDYNVGIQYQTYNITEMLSENNNVSIHLGKGWYMGRFGLDSNSEIYGNRMATIAEIHIETEDGDVEIIPTDISWNYCGSDIEDSGIYDGEIYNRMLWNDKENISKSVEIISIDKNKLIERYSIPVCVKEEIKPVKLINTPAGEYVIDMGQNFAGYIEFNSKLQKGTKVELNFGEILLDGNFYNGNYGTAVKGFTYISGGVEEVVRPHFTYYGFRYVRITGWPEEIDITNFVGKVIYSDLERTGYIETSNEKINRLYANCMYSQKSNFIDMPTDCPQRSERLGWTGDAQVFAPTANYNMDTRAFYNKYLKDLRNEQIKLNGGIPNYLPNIDKMSGNISSVWGDAATIIPDELYKSYGDLSYMENYYPMMKEWVDYVNDFNNKNESGYLYSKGFHFGDWLALDGVTPNSFKGGTNDAYIASIYYYNSAKIVAQMAEALTKVSEEYKEEAKKYNELAEEIKKAILEEFFTKSGRLAIDTQSAYIIALKYGIYIDREKLINGFKERLKKDCYEIKGGFVGAPLLCSTLGELGMDDLAYHFLFKESFPSWLYCVNLGATTIWERWNSVLSDGRINGVGMNSLNHYAYGSVIEYLYKYVVGIRSIEPGFKKVSLNPSINMKFRYVKGEYKSVSGKYVLNWSIQEDGNVSVHIEIPFGCEAEVILPRYEECTMNLKAGKYDFTYMPSSDFRCIYSKETLFEDFAKDQEVMDILREKMPPVFGMIMSRDKESLGRCINDLYPMFFLGLSETVINEVADKICNLKRW